MCVPKFHFAEHIYRYQCEKTQSNAHNHVLLLRLIGSVWFEFLISFSSGTLGFCSSCVCFIFFMSLGNSLLFHQLMSQQLPCVKRLLARPAITLRLCGRLWVQNGVVRSCTMRKSTESKIGPRHQTSLDAPWWPQLEFKADRYLLQPFTMILKTSPYLRQVDEYLVADPWFFDHHKSKIFYNPTGSIACSAGAREKR